MTWALHRVSLATHDLAAARAFFGVALGIGQSSAVDENTIAFGTGSRGVRICKPQRSIHRVGKEVVGPMTARHVAIEVSDLNSVVSRLDKAGCSHVEAPAGDFDGPAIYTFDPAFNAVAFCQARTPLTAELQPWEKALGWGASSRQPVRRQCAGSGCFLYRDRGTSRRTLASAGWPW